MDGLLTYSQLKFLDECKAHHARLVKCQKEADKLPKGSVTRQMVKGKTYYRHSMYENGKRKCKNCTKEEGEKLTQQINRRKHLEIEILFLKHLLQDIHSIGSKLITHSQQLLIEYYSNNKANSQQIINQLFPDTLSMKGTDNIRTRSKSELLITERFKAHKMIYTYEAPLNLPGQKTFFPDFTLYEPLSGKTIYWEHFGLMDNKDYRLHAENKLQIYKNAGIVQGDTLLVSYDEPGGGIDMTKIEKIIQNRFFLGQYKKMLL